MFDSNHDGFIDMKELRQVTVMLGAMLTKEELEDFMAEADKVENENVKHE
jgi:Ca2+-binding EF-hand superfamily protein